MGKDTKNNEPDDVKRSTGKSSTGEGKAAPINKTRRADNFDDSPLLSSLSQFSVRERENIQYFVNSLVKKAGLIGALKINSSLSSKLIPVFFKEGYKNPLLLKTIQVPESSREDLKSLIQNLSPFLKFESYNILENKNNNTVVLSRTYYPLTLEDVLLSSMPVSIKGLFDCLVRLFSYVESLHNHDIIHGHITPGNVCYRGDLDGQMLDAGIALFERAGKTSEPESYAPEFLKAKPDFKLDSYGLGYTLNKIFNNVELEKGDNLPLLETIYSSLRPLISALMNKSQDKRPDASLAKMMLIDLLPVVYHSYTSPEDNSTLPKDDSSKMDSKDHKKKNESDETKNKENESSSVTEDIKDEGSKEELNHESLLHEDELKVDENEKEVDFEKQVDDDISHEIKKSSFLGNLIFVILLAALALAIYLSFDRFKRIILDNSSEAEYQVSSGYEGPFLNLDELRLSWASQVPSRMKTVALQAVHQSNVRELAEQVILTSLRRNEINSELVDEELLRVAFYDSWEAELDETDRRYALSLGLIDLLQDRLPPELGLIEDRHPGVLLAILSAANKRVLSLLGTVPAEKLTQLASPFGTSFKILTAGRKGLKATDDEVVNLARFSTRGIENPEKISIFLKKDFERRMSALAVAYSQNDEYAIKLLDTIINNSKISLSNTYVEWAKKVELTQLDEIESVDRLFLLAGVPLREEKTLPASTIAKLFLHPSSRIRGYAAGLATQEIDFKHPASQEILELIKISPDMLTGDQLVMLGQILEDPDKTVNTHRDIIKKFLLSNPSIGILKTLLISTAKSSTSTKLDSAISIYLSEIDWTPDASDLLTLSLHPDKVTRMFAYKNIFEFKDKEHAILLLKGALKKEPVEEFRDQLEELIESLEKE